MAYVPPHRRGRREASTTGRNNVTAAPAKTLIKKASLEDSQKELDLDVLNKALNHICCINLDARTDKWKLIQRDAEKVGKSFQQRIERCSAVEGKTLKFEDEQRDEDVCLDWDGSTDANYNRHGRPGLRTMTPSEAGCALSHIKLWRQLAGEEHHDSSDDENNDATMLILEDDARFSNIRGNSRFASAFAKAWKLLPEDWGLLYLGLSARGERTWLDETTNDAFRTTTTSTTTTTTTTTTTNSSKKAQGHDRMNPPIRLYKPEYGYHTHAYVIRRTTAQVLLQNLPICGPIDVWLGDNQWFSQQVYCAVIAQEGWKLEDGTHEGKDLVFQERYNITNDIEHCA
jgi:GR25 family glycosyltransferase involved in LPS biosynthesis